MYGSGIPADPEAAIFIFQKHADRGDVGAVAALGSCYLEGAPGFPKKPELAERILEIASSSGHPGAQSRYGYCLIGHGKTSEGLALMKKAADTDTPSYQYHYAHQLLCVNENDEEGLLYLRVSANQGHPDALARYGEIQLPKDRATGMKYLKAAAESTKGDPRAATLYAINLFRDKKPKEEVLHHLTKGIDSKVPHACLLAGFLLASENPGRA
jgi:TPR repeat protein